MKDTIKYKLATKDDLPFIIEMLSDDKLGSLREDYQLPLPQSYIDAFNEISTDKNQELTVVKVKDEIIATFQLSFIQYLTYQGGVRSQIEAVRVKSTYRRKGIGKLIFEYAIERAKSKGAHLLQLTTDKKRPEALEFYRSLGFVDTHEGMKIHFKR